MVRRPWIILVSLIILFIAFAGLVTFRYLNRSNVLRDRIMAELSPVDGDFEIGRASLQPNNLVLHRVSFRSPDSTLHMSIERISIRIAASNLLQHSGDLLRVVESVSLEEPKITFRPDRKIKLYKPEADSTEADFDLGKFSNLDRVILLDGSFSLMTGSDDEWISITGIEGWINSTDDNRLNLTLSASLTGDSLRQINARGSGSLEDRSMQVRLDMDELDISNIIFPLSSPLYDLNGSFELHADASLDTSGWDANANWRLTEAQAMIDESGGLLVDHVNLSGLLENRIATFDGSARFEGDDADVHGELDLDNLIFRGETEVPEVHIAHHLETFADLEAEHQPQGTVATRGEMTIDLNTGRMDLKALATGDELGSPVGPFRDIVMLYSWDNQRWELRFDSLATEWYGLHINGNGRFRPSEDIDFSVFADYSGHGEIWNMPDWVEPVTSKHAQGRVTIHRYPDEGFVISSQANLQDRDNPAFGEFQGRYSRYGYDVNLDLFSLQKPDAQLHLQKLGDEALKIETSQPQLVLGWWDEKYQLTEFINDLDIIAQANLNHNTLNTLTTIKNPATNISLRVAGESILDSTAQFSTSAGYQLSYANEYLGNGSFDAVYEDGTLRLDQASFMDVLSANGEIDFDARVIHEIIVSVEGMDLAYLLPASIESDMEQIGGIINGRFKISGSFDNPEIDSHFELSDGQYGELRDYWGLLTLNTERGEVNISQGAFGRESTTIFTLIGGYDIEKDDLGLNIESPSSDANVLMSAMTGQKDLLTGEANLRGFVNGPLSRPSWLAELDMNVGTLGGIEFETVQVRLHGISSERLGHVVYVDTAALSRPDNYELTISGAVPLDRGAGELDISLEGDILGLFPQISDFITDASGRGLLDWSTTIVAGKPVAARGKLTVENGRMEFADVFPVMTDLDVDITIDTDGLVNIRQARGEFQNEYAFELSNLPGEDDDSTRQAIHFRSPEIDFGVLKMRTLDEQGIPFRLPGINTTEQYSRLAVSGKQDDWLTIAGPADSLYIDGQLRLLSAVFTYPPVFEEDQVDILSAILPREALFLGLENSSTVTKTPAFINNARWDVQAYVGNDVKYERIVKGLENAPFLETFSEFLGQIELDVDLQPTDPDFPINVTGAISDSTFRMNGTVVSTTGRIEFLDMLFSMDRAEIAFDQTSVYPVVSARAVANVAEQDFTRQMYLTLYVIDPVTGERRQRGRWGEITFVLEDEAGSSQEEVLSAMGVGISDLQGLQNRVITSGAGGLDRAMARRWLGPVEQDAAEFLGLDIVQFRPQLATNLVGPKPTDIFYNTTEEDQRTAANTGSRNLFRASRVVLGKYIDRNTYISYTGQFGEEARYASVEDIQLGRLGLLQKWNLEYRIQPISPNFVIELGWEYENVEDQNNRSARMKYSVVFDIMELNTRQLWRDTFYN